MTMDKIKSTNILISYLLALTNMREDSKRIIKRMDGDIKISEEQGAQIIEQTITEYLRELLTMIRNNKYNVDDSLINSAKGFVSNR